MYNEKNDFGEIVDLQQTLFLNLKRNHRFYFIFSLSYLPFWISFIVLILFLMNRPHEPLVKNSYIVPIMLFTGNMITVLLLNTPLIVKGSNQLRAITLTQKKGDEPVKFLSGIAKYVNTMYSLISNSTYPKSRKHKFSSKRARNFEIGHIIQHSVVGIVVILLPIVLWIAEPVLITGAIFIIPYIFLVLSYIFIAIISVRVIRNMKRWQILFTELEYWADSLENMSIEELNE